MAAAKATPTLDAIFGVEPKGVTARPTWQVLKVCAYLRDEDTLMGRTTRELSEIKK